MVLGGGKVRGDEREEGREGGVGGPSLSQLWISRVTSYQ